MTASDELEGRRAWPRRGGLYRPSPPGRGRWRDRATKPAAASRVIARVAPRGRVGRELAWWLDSVRVGGTSRAIRQIRTYPGSADPEGRWNAFYRRIWDHAAITVGAEVEALPSGFLRLNREGHSTVVWQSNVMLDTAVTVRFALDKTVCNRLLAGAGLPVPGYCEFRYEDLGQALARLESEGGRWVIKPARGTGGGQGVTCGASTADDLLRAAVRARRWEPRLLMERELRGCEYRLLFLDGELLDVIQRRPPQLVGDGRSTVARLIEGENRRRIEAVGDAGLSLIDVDLDCVLALRRSGLSLDAVPACGQVFAVKAAANAGGPGDTQTMRQVSPNLVAEASRAAAVVGVRLAGVDVITTDHLRGIAETGGAIVEVNALPGLHYHYLVDDAAAARPVAVPILRKLLQEAAL